MNAMEMKVCWELINFFYIRLFYFLVHIPQVYVYLLKFVYKFYVVGLPVKEESEEDPNSRTIEPTTFVNVSLACDEAGPSGLQQQKIADMPEIPMPQTADGDPKSG